MNAKQHLEKLSGYGAQMKAIEQDSRYSASYQETLKQALRAEMKSQIAALPGDLTAEYKAARAAYEKADKAFTQAVAGLQEGWDYARLNYAGEAVRAQVGQAREVYDIQQAYNAAQADKHQARAWHEIGAQVIAAKFGEVEAGQLLNQLKRDQEAAANTPEVVKARQAGAAVINSIVELQHTVRGDGMRAGIVTILEENQYTHDAGRVYDISKAIEVRPHWEGTGYKYSVEFPEDSPASAESAAPAAQPGGEAAPAAA